MIEQTALRGINSSFEKAPARSPEHLSTVEKRAALAAVSSEIVHYGNVLRVLKKQQRELEDSLKLVAYPVLNLPTKITSQIFAACLPWHGRVRPSPKAAPLLLAQICRQWREVALATCELWSSIDLDVQYAVTFNPGRQHLLKNWLSRAKGHSLLLTFRRSEQMKITSEILTSGFAFAGQIQRLELDLPTTYKELQQFLPLPQFLALRCFRSYSYNVAVQEILRNSPALRELGLYSFTPSLFPGLQLLTHLEIGEEILIGDFLYIFTQLPLLLHLACTVDPDTATETPVAKTIPELTSLRLHSAEGVISFVTLPRLHRLVLASKKGSVDEGVPDLDCTISFLKRSSCVLDHLAISVADVYVDWNEADITRILKAVPSVTTLDVTVKDNLEGFLSSMNSKPSLLPRLQHLIVSTTSQDINYEDVIDILQARRQSYVPLKLRSFLLKIQFDDLDEAPQRSYPGNMETSALNELIAGGLELGIRHEDAEYIYISGREILYVCIFFSPPQQ
ncbi:hypothetical protein C8R43DRAFT_595786 [Mycena crocata]|nr:hypothetical protein C8R43DRAFT_595786 [Mycena crocata]